MPCRRVAGLPNILRQCDFALGGNAKLLVLKGFGMLRDRNLAHAVAVLVTHVGTDLLSNALHRTIVPIADEMNLLDAVLKRHAQGTGHQGRAKTLGAICLFTENAVSASSHHTLRNDLSSAAPRIAPSAK